MYDVAVIPKIYLERARVADTAHHRKPTIAMNRTVELMAVNHQHAAVVGSAMEEKRMTFDRAEQHPNQLAVMLIMIAGNEDDPGTAPAPRPDLLNHRGLIGCPAPPGTHVPPVDDVANQEQIFCAVPAEKFEQGLRLAARGSQMKVRNPDGAAFAGWWFGQWQTAGGTFRGIRPPMNKQPTHRDAAPSVPPTH